MKLIAIIASQTFNEIYKSKILLNVVLLGSIIGMAIFVSAQMTYGAAPRVGLDIGLGMLSFSSVGIAIFMGATLLDKEIKSRTLYMIISRPVSRRAFYFGKMLGLSGILFVNILLLLSFVFILYILVGGSYHYLIPWSALFIFVESLVVMFAVVMFSLLSNTILTVMFSITMYVAGHAVESVKETSLFKTDKILNLFIDIYSKYLPNFSKFNIKEYVLYDGKLSNSYLLSSFGYGVIWIIFFAIISSYIIDQKDFS